MSNNKMLIDSSHPEETRVAMVRGNRVDEFDFESEHKTQLRGNIYLAKVTRVEPSLQAAFVDYGGNRHGFLAFSEIHPDYYQIPMADRQALIDADAEDARREAEAQAIEDDEDGSDEVEAQSEEDAPEEKAPRKRRTRRRSKKSEKTVEANADEESSDESAPEETKTEVSEEDDDSEETMNADNDGDDVVSEPAAEAEEKPKKRRTSRKKAEPAEDVSTDADAEETPKPKKKRATTRTKKAKSEETISEDVPAETSDEEKPKKRRTTRRKKADDVAEESITVDEASEPAEDTSEAAEKPKKRRSTRRKKAEQEETVSDPVVNEDSQGDDVAETAQDSEEAGEEENKSKRTRGRRRSRGRGRKKNQNDNGNNDDDDEENGSVEAVGAEDALEEVPTRRSSRRHYKIQEVIKRRQILLVQVVKEERGNKGAALTTYLSLAGRYSVLMPNTARGGGISRKITNAADRKRLKAIAGNLDVPAGMGVILRTAGASRDKAEVQRDFEYLLRLWENVRTLTLESTAPCLTYEEGSLIKRSIRDLYDKDTGEILVAGEAGFREAKDFMAMLMPEHAKNVKLYKDRVPLFAKMGVEAQLDAMLQPQVTLKSGGYLVINQTEALVAIDVNSGRSTRQHSIEETATQTNLEAADEVARQLRLRDLAGLIVIDFIDMEERRNNRNVEKRLKDALKHDRARIQVGRISHFGLMEMSRQRIRASVLESTTQVCPTCDGIGHVRAASSVVLGVLRAVEEQLNKNARNNLTVKVRAPTALYLLNNKRENLSDLETRFRVAITIEIDDSVGLEPCVIERGELAYKPPVTEEAVQPDTISPDEASQDESSETVNADASDQPSVTSDDNGDGNRPKRRRRRRKRRSEEEKSDGAEAVQSADDAADVEQETSSPDDAGEKKPSRRRRRKKTSDEAAEDTKVDAEEVSSVETEADDKPKRRTRRAAAPKVAAEESVVETVSEVPTTSESDDGEIETKPKRRTTRRKTSEEADAPVTEAKAEAEESTGDEPKKEGWWRRKFF